MKIKYICNEDKKAQADNGGVYLFNKANDYTCDVKEKELAEHLLNFCGDRFVKIDTMCPVEEIQEQKPEVKKKRGRRKKQ